VAEERVFRYEPAGPVLKAFHESPAFVRGIRGPVGSGKTTGLAVEVFRRARLQAPGPDGIRHSRFAVLRNTEPQLKSTTLRTFMELLPPCYCKVSYDSPITMRIQAGDLDCEIIFLALDLESDTRKLLSLELTGLVLNEARELPRSILDLGTTRVGRYPSAREGGATWSGVLMDSNPCDTEHWWYQLAESERPKGWEFFAQPSGLSQDAENLHNLNQTPETLKLAPRDLRRREQGRRYYLRISEGKTEDWLKVYVRGEYGFSLDGKAVFPEYSDLLHTSQVVLEPLPHTPVVVGLDPGLAGSAAIFLQRDARGRWLAVHELVAEDVGLEQFGRLLLGELSEAFPDVTGVQVWADPATGARSQLDARSAIKVLRDMNLPVRLAPTNDILVRLEAVRRVLSRLVDARPGLIICPNCTKLRKALTSYHYRRLHTSGSERYHDVPEKDAASHPVDALCYALIGGGESRAPGQQNRIRPAYALM
jgi:hypothetical protein